MRRLSEADQAAWAAYARHLKPLAGRSVPVLPAEVPNTSPAPVPPAKPGGVRAAAPPRRASVAIGTPPGGLDAATWQRFRSGRTFPSRRLDLHGFTAQRAFQALSHFLKVAHADRVRCVEIVTGRGSAEGTGVIRRELPLWLNLPDLQPLILAATHPQAGNPGAVRLLLRRTRGD